MFLIFVVIARRIVFVKYDWRWLWSRWLDHDTDADGDARCMPHFPPQTTAKYPRDHNHRQPDQREIQINSIVRDGVIQKMKHGVQNFSWVQVHIASLVYAFGILITGSNESCAVCPSMVPHPFKFAQRRQFHLGLARIRAMNGLAVVAQILLRKPFGIARLFCPFRPRIAIAVQRHAFDAKSDRSVA